MRTLTALARAGREAWVLLVVQMAGPKCFRPNDQMDPAFGQALREAAAAGVQIHCVDCLVTEDSLSCRAPVPGAADPGGQGDPGPGGEPVP